MRARLASRLKARATSRLPSRRRGRPTLVKARNKRAVLDAGGSHLAAQGVQGIGPEIAGSVLAFLIGLTPGDQDRAVTPAEIEVGNVERRQLGAPGQEVAGSQQQRPIAQIAGAPPERGPDSRDVGRGEAADLARACSREMPRTILRTGSALVGSSRPPPRRSRWLRRAGP